ncbi:MAG: trypsin-like peptidase domain-containing protein [Lachnospiraceae bacterium]|nr:trypsin-like peptidase domain-containing protein [Lachnospiraceae bacterium]
MPALVSVNNKYTEMLNYFGQTYYQDAEGAGSGIIVGQNDDQLLIVTNYHVVKDAKELTVTFDDNSEAEAKLEGKDADKDLAVISVQTALISADTKNAISVAKLGDSDTLTVGEPVIAIGNSLGYGQSVTTGVVSALNRPIAAALSDEEYGDKEIATFIQTDAAINPGNSGGALLNISGEVIGINSNKIGGSVVEGMGYAIPISSAKPIIENMINKQTRTRVDEGSKGVLGITGVDVDADLSLSYGIPMGVYISSVNEGSGADAAGLMKGDIITGMNGEDISCMDDLKNELSYFSAGQTVQLQIMQGTPVGYQKKTIEVVLQAAPQ